MTADLYAILEVERSASGRQIRSAYRRLARRYHPDHNPAEDAAQCFTAIAEAYNVLSDASRRATYDHSGHIPPTIGSALHEEESAFE